MSHLVVDRYQVLHVDFRAHLNSEMRSDRRGEYIVERFK